MKTKPDIKKLAVEIYKVALKGAGLPVRERISWDDRTEIVKNSTIAIARWHLKHLERALSSNEPRA